MEFSEKEISEIKKFVIHLNSQKDSVVVVEGKRDSNALRKLGFSGKILEFHSFRGLVKFSDSVAKYKNVILLLDGDKKGRYLTKRIIDLLAHRVKIDLSFKKKLVSITKGKIRFIEQLVCYESYFV
ncbi:MAG: toprim domain-containing protein [Candidatus Nitrosopelagicus sp.]|jgi:5S rRNA maturation endonuclease (ribonuclease M5)|uniref:Toprim domain-containing protein n=1 Tax=marine metagenome TaxID=408172 RepID=A0A382DNE1_9ZZZZ|nr:toprim domain-containing protein [Candidatus Nitrosopelagicus sp.]|tara:strand:+ start:646 stop:1023 length:378 start_codon:yes stop_codon:yes gene_type:complete